MNNKSEQKSSFFRDGLSIDESKTSLLMITYLINFIVILVFFVKTKDAESLKAIFFANISAITGINVTHSISQAFNGSSYKNENIPKG